MNDDVEPLESSSQQFVPVCAIGASAGGVTALQGLFRLLPNNLGLAYVVVLHLSPDQPSALSDILSGCTRMPVLQIQDGPALRPDCVYVIPPDRELVIQGDSVTARPFSEPRGRRAPIDMFFRSIAAARGDGVAIVLSGAGADGALGVQAVKEAGGVIMVQEPAEAAFPSMPQNAIASGVADFVAPLARLAERLAEVARSKEAVRSLDMDGSANDLRRIVAFLRARTGHDFSSYKRATVMRRVLRRMQVCRTDNVAAYADYLAATPEEAKELFSDLLISVTMFFRDARAFEALQRHAIRPIFDDLDPEKEESIRAWVVGCATGEEAYSTAMLLHEEADRRKTRAQFQIFATDLDEGALATAREGRYPRSIEADVSDERLARFFIDEGTHYRVRKELRESVLFATHSVLKEPPFMRLDLITCRNLLIYMERTLQQQICSIFHYGLRQGRFLFLGSAETADAASDLFVPLDRDARIYGSRPQATHALPILPQFTAPERFTGPDQPFIGRTERSDLPVALHASALERTAPASALVDGAHNIVHLSPSAGRFILHSAGPVSNQLPAIVRPELRLDLRLALTLALDAKEPTLTHPTIVVLDGDRRRISMHVAPVPNGMHMGAQALVLFLDGGSSLEDEKADDFSDAQPDEIRRLHAELKAAQEAVVASRAGHEASIQDLRATNEELQSINEEYRSTAEELETSKEELQSINEELHTVNAELKSKLASISVAHSDLQNLTDATVGTLFLDGDLRIKMFTPPIADLFNITKGDYGRTITDFSHRLDYDAIDGDARQVLRQLAPIEREVHSREARSYVLRMRPYRTIEDRIDGVVVTFYDITDRLQAEAALRESEAKYRTLFETMGEGYGFCELIRDSAGQAIDWRYLELNPALERHSGMDARAVVGHLFSELFPDTDRSYWLGIYQTVTDTQSSRSFEDYWAPIDRWIAGEASPAGGELFYVIYRDVTEQKRAELVLRESEERQAFLLKLSDLLRPHVDTRKIKAAAAAVVSEWLDIASAGYAEVETGGLTAVITDEFNDGRIPSLTARYTLADFSSVTDPMRRGETIHFADLDDDGVSAETRTAFSAIDVRAAVATPLIKNGVMVAYLFVAHPEPRVWTTADLDILKEVAERTWAAVERARAEAALQASEALRRVALEGGSMGTWRWNLEERLVWGDAKFMALWGLPPSDDPQPLSLFTERMSPEGAHEMEVIVTRAIEADEEFDGPLEIVSGPTRGRWIRWRGQANKGTPSTLYGVTFDITEQRKAEHALRESEQRFAQFAASSSDGLWIRNAATLAMEYVSPAIETIYGVRPDAFLGDVKHWAGLIVPDDRDAAFKHIEAARAGDAVVHEFRIQRPSDGAFRWIRNTDFPLLDAQGGVQRIGGIAEDVTESKLAAEHQGVLLAELQHRVRNIMAMIRSVTARTGERAASVEDYASLMMGRLLALARVQALLTRAANASVGIAAIVRDEVSVQAQHEGQYVLDGPDIALSPKAAEVLTLAVHELATNALKYGALSVPDGKLTVTWSTIQKRDTPWLTFDWTEDGTPTQPAAAPDAPRRRGFGSELIEGRVPYELRGKGKITIEPGGARCHLEFPLREGASILETGAPPRASVFGGALDMTGEPDLSGYRVLVVEDDYFLATDAVRALRGAGAEIMGPCGSEEDARAELEGQHPDAVILDINLGPGPSFKLAEHLKDNGIPFVFTTGYDQEVIPAEFGAIERLEKPFQLRQIVGTASRLVSKTA